MAATDSFRLGEKKVNFKEPLGILEEHSLILPQRSASLLVSIFGEREANLSLYFSPNLLMIESPMEETDHPKIQFVSKLIEGEYPKYQEIIPQDYKTETFVSKREFLNQLKAASLFASRINEVKLKFDDKAQKVEVSCQNPDLGEYSSAFAAEIKGAKAEVSFNYKFLLDGLASTRGDKILFALSQAAEGEEGPAVLKGEEDKSYLYVVMPIQPA
jgi:DNA polymerase-3 subunit beta